MKKMTMMIMIDDDDNVDDGTGSGIHHPCASSLYLT